MTTIFTACLLFLAAGEPGPAPAIVVDQPAINAGSILQGELARFAFTVKNEGTAPLELKVKTNCGCTVARFDNSIAPGGVGKIEADLKTSGMKGTVHKTVQVTTNDPQRPRLALKLSANVVHVLEIERIAGSTLYLQHGEPLHESFLVRVHPEQTLEVTSADCDVPFVTATVRPIDADTDGTRRYEVRLSVATDAPFGRTGVTITVHTTSPSWPTHIVRLSCEKGIVAAPATVSFGVVRPSTKLPLTRNLLVKSREGGVKLLSIESTDPHVEVRVTTLRDGAYHLLKLAYQGGGPLGRQQAVLRIQTDQPSQSQLEVPIAYEVAVGETSATEPELLGSNGGLRSVPSLRVSVAP